MPAQRKLIVSFHDLHPGSRSECERFLAMLRDLDVGKSTLLAVPRWHGAAPCNQDRQFAAWLRDKADQGHEICLHAYTHLADKVEGNSFERAVGRHYTASEGEFYRITETEAAARLREGLKIVSEGCGVPVWGFTAPAWLLGRDGMLALRKAGFHYTTRWDAVDLLQPPDRPVATIAAPTLVWSVRARWRRVCSRAWIRMWGIAQSRAEVLRIAVHPVDFAHPKVEASVRAAIARHLADRTTARYCDLLPAGAQPMGCVR